MFLLCSTLTSTAVSTPLVGAVGKGDSIFVTNWPLNMKLMKIKSIFTATVGGDVGENHRWASES